MPPRFGYNLRYTLAVLVWFLLFAGALYLVIWDQRYRCRVCLRRLRMPVETGSWSRMLQFGRPRIEYICPYGHGTLREDELQISGSRNPEWTPHSDDIWAELCASGKELTTDREPRSPMAHRGWQCWCWPALFCFWRLFAPIYFRNLEAAELCGRTDTDVWTIRRSPTTCYATMGAR